jgi:hypothetical protein
VLYAVDSNSGASRTGTLTVAGRTVTVTQAAGTAPPPPPPACTYTLSKSTDSYDNKKHDDTVKITTTASCAWTASSDATWITFPDGDTGTGTATLKYTVAANGTKAERTGTITINGQTLEITQRK